jgi:hypothetical protein
MADDRRKHSSLFTELTAVFDERALSVSTETNLFEDVGALIEDSV